MKIISRIPTKAKYSYFELQGEVEDFLALTKEQLLEISSKHDSCIKLYNISAIQKIEEKLSPIEKEINACKNIEELKKLEKKVTCIKEKDKQQIAYNSFNSKKLLLIT